MRTLALIALAACGGGGGGGGGGDAGGGSDGSITSPIAGARIFYTDLTSGPNSGGEGGNGAYVTIYGNGFGSAQSSSTVTVGGGTVAAYPAWSETKITVQLGAAAATGDVVVHVAGKADSNAAMFTVRVGTIYFVTSTGGDDHADGSFAHPWATIPMAKNTIAAGDIAYLGAHAGDTLVQDTLDASSSYNCALGMSVNDGTNAGTAAMPKALVIYPGATATIGAETGIERGIVTPGIGGTFDFWVIAGLTLRGTQEALDFEGGGDGWRVIGNDISCPNGFGTTGCVNGSVGPTNLAFYGNDVHDAAANVTSISKYYHGIYFGSSHLDLGWNVVRDGKTCRGIQFHDTGGPNEFDVHVHDNVIHDTVCDGINFSTMDPSQGVVEAYNNVIYSVGTGPDPVEASSDYAGIYVVQETDNDGSIGSGQVDLYNNTFYDCGSLTSDSSASAIHFDPSSAPALTLRLRDNLMLAKTSAERYVLGDVTGSNNLIFAGTGSAGGATATVMADPLLVAPATADFHLGSGSPAIDMGVDTGLTYDLDGNPRPLGAALDIGAYERAP